MLNKINRLTSNFQFNITRKYGQKYEGAYVYVYVLKPQKYNGDTKVGIVVPNKFHKKAVRRNRVKRLFRESLKDKIKDMGNSRWVVLHPKFNCLGITYEEINSDLTKVLQKVSFAD